MGIVASIYGFVRGAAEAMIPKEPQRDPNVIKIQIVDEQPTHREQLVNWINGGDEPEKVRRIKENIKHTDLVLRGESSDAAWRKISQERSETRYEKEMRHRQEYGSRDIRVMNLPNLGGTSKGRGRKNMNFNVKMKFKGWKL